MKKVFVSGGFDDLKSNRVRLLQEAARLGTVRVVLWTDALVKAVGGHDPKFPYSERAYLLGSLRYVDEVTRCSSPAACEALPTVPGGPPDIWIVDESQHTHTREAYCRTHGIEYRVLRSADLQGFPEDEPPAAADDTRKRVIATGCYDWFHSGHVRFFEECSALGDLYVTVGNDANVRLLKGEGHPMFCEEERRYLVQSVRFVKQCFVATGSGWLDAEPEIERIKPHVYAVNEDGDKPEKREYCEARGIEYVVLKRTPKPGLAARTSTNLRGF